MAEIRCPLMDKEVDGFECNNSSIEEQVRDSYFITLLKQAYGHRWTNSWILYALF